MTAPLADPTRLHLTFAGGDAGPWRVESLRPVVGEELPAVSRLAIRDGAITSPAARAAGSAWELHGVTSYERYVHARERDALIALQPPLGRREATRAALIPITKPAEWWTLPQDARCTILEERSHHIATGLRYLPAVARRLHHGRDLGEPFDFLTWFEYAPGDAAAFEDLVGALRATEEWRYVEREVNLRLVWESESPRDAPSRA